MNMKWRLKFGDPRVGHHNFTTQCTFDVPAGPLAEEGWVHPDLKSLEEILLGARNDARVQHVAWVLLEAKLISEEEAAMKWAIPYPIARLTFDPTVLNAVPYFRAVWADPLARTIWLAVNHERLVNQHFEKECLAVAHAIRRMRPTTVDVLQTVVRVWMQRNQPGLVGEELFWNQLLECVLGTRQIGYEVIEEVEAATV